GPIIFNLWNLWLKNVSARRAARDGLDEGHGGAGAAEVGGEGVAGGQGGFDGFAQAGGGIVLAEVVEHLRGAQQQRAGVGHALAGDVRGRAVDRLEDRRVGADVGARGQAEAADQAGAQVG